MRKQAHKVKTIAKVICNIESNAVPVVRE
jgi:hypothetical protein